MAKAQNYTVHISLCGEQLWRRKLLEEGGGTIGVGTPHNIEMAEVSKKAEGWLACWLAGCLAGSITDYSTTSWLHLAS